MNSTNGTICENVCREEEEVTSFLKPHVIVNSTNDIVHVNLPKK